MLACGGYQNITLYDMKTMQAAVNFESVSKNVTRVGFEENGRWMYTGGEDCRLRIWDMKAHTPQREGELFCPAPINSVCLHPNQVELAVALQTGGVMLWDVKTERHHQLLSDIDAAIQDVAISPDGMFMAAVTNNGLCYIWSMHAAPNNILSKPELKTTFVAHRKYGLRCKFSPDSNLLLTTSADSTVKLWHTSDFSLYRELSVELSPRWVWDAAFTSDSQYLFTASSDGIARLWKVDSKEVDRQYIGHQKAITALAFRDEFADGR